MNPKVMTPPLSIQQCPEARKYIAQLKASHASEMEALTNENEKLTQEIRRNMKQSVESLKGQEKEHRGHFAKLMKDDEEREKRKEDLKHQLDELGRQNQSWRERVETMRVAIRNLVALKQANERLFQDTEDARARCDEAQLGINNLELELADLKIQDVNKLRNQGTAGLGEVNRSRHREAFAKTHKQFSRRRELLLSVYFNFQANRTPL
ncbi:hypothetical protein BJ508DRAFT_380600 [Ascobolus immersus RN42]|uniref:Uncharacterized protein n=1 Tax=Ascobolus immersus RN42 TaxID=1160509 RepID=A0A3N4HN79_ASCIM|nr:hypothetical protein BJ508DRAFT_380600 [Ascobolus immersus RN42]